jgi:DNA-binding transcriptional MerR regulator
MNELATYNLGTVLRETGINADTLRAWERRYKLPEPQRTDGGHRLYSERDIAIIKWLLSQQEDGMRIGQAVKLWRSRLKEGSDPLYEKGSPESTEAPLDISQLEGFRNRWVDACLDFNEALAEQVANDAFTRFSTEVAFIEIFLPSIRMVGQLWYEGKVSVQQEHFASALLMRRLDALITTSPLPTRPEKIIVACPPKEEHTLSSLLLTLFLRRRGFHVVYLGTNVPLAEFEETVELIKPQLVLLTAQQLTTAATLEETARALAPCGVTIGYSGGIFNTTPDIREYISGEFLGATFDEVFANIETLLRNTPDLSTDFPAPYANLLEAFEVGHIGIHAHLNTSLAKWNFPLKQLADSTVFLSQCIAASLYLGDLDLLLPELAWVETLLEHRNISEYVRVGHFLRAYANSAHETMGDIAAPLVDWLEAQSVANAEA